MDARLTLIRKRHPERNLREVLLSNLVLIHVSIALCRSWSGRNLPLAPMGRPKPAQGNALGGLFQRWKALKERPNPSKLFNAPLQGSNPFPTLPRALPWAAIGRPLGATKLFPEISERDLCESPVSGLASRRLASQLAGGKTAAVATTGYFALSRPTPAGVAEGLRSLQDRGFIFRHRWCRPRRAQPPANSLTSLQLVGACSPFREASERPPVTLCGFNLI